ncbi:MAG TPA: S9 family peptidase [Opitutaceae bacterium]|nr:S9 family peptidase [Opitutaceae bacterium]
MPSLRPKPLWSFSCALFLLLLALSCEHAEARDERLIGAMDLLKIKELDSPVFSPDGSRIVYIVRSIEPWPEANSEQYVYHTQLWMVLADGHSAPRQLTRGDSNSYSPVWSPAGDRIAFVRSERGKKPQIWVLPMPSAGGGEAVPITHFASGASNPRWSPDGTQLLFSATLNLTEALRELQIVKPAVPVPWFSERPGRRFADTENWAARARPSNEANPVPAKPDGNLQEQREWLAKNEVEGDPVVTNRLDFLGEQDLEPTEAFTHLYAIDAEEGAAPVPLTPGFASYQDALWYPGPNGLQILFSGDAQVSRHPDRILERDLWVVGANGGPLKRMLHDEQIAYTAPALSPDGTMIAFLAVDLTQAGFAHSLLCVLPTRGGPRRFLTTSLDRSVQSFRWAADSQSLYFVAASNGAFPLYRVGTTPGSRIDRLTGFSLGILGFDVRSTGIAAVVTRPSNPAELYLLNTKGSDPIVVTSHNSEWLKGKLVSLPERRDITLSDGTQIESYEMKPTLFEPSKKYPIVVEIHGGPQAMWGPGTANSWHEFQYFTGRGYGIVFCNPRGSTGYGAAFQREIYRNWGPGPSQDVLAATAAAEQNGWTDVNREVITGGSYGGYLTVWLISQDHRFKAAAAQRGVYELSVFFGEGNAWRLVPYHFGGYPWQPEVRAILDAQSPISHVNRITTPLLINHGDSDLRTGVIQSEMLYKSLKVLGLPVEYVRYPGATHELSRSGDPGQRVDRLVRLDEFFQRFIGPVGQ